MAFLASAKPIFPVERLDINLTGSIVSLVGPAVTHTLSPFISFSCASSLKIYERSTSGSGILPSPVSPHARYPLAGFITSIP